MHSEIDPLSGEMLEELVLLSHQGALEVIHELLLKGSVREATQLSHLLMTTPSALISDRMDAEGLEAGLYDCVECHAYTEGVTSFETRNPAHTPSPEAERLAGVCYGWCGQDEEARHHLIRAWGRGSHQAILDLASLERRALRPISSLRWLERAQAAVSETSEAFEVELQLQFAETHRDLRAFDQARRHLLQAQEGLPAKHDLRVLLAQVLDNLAALEFEQTQFVQAFDHTSRRLEVGSVCNKKVTWLYRALSLACLGRDDEARAAFESTSNVELLDPLEQVISLIAHGILSWLTNDRYRANARFQSAVEMAGRYGMHHALFIAAGLLVMLTHQLGQTDAMRHWRDRLKALLESGQSGPRFEALGRLTETYVYLAEDQADRALEVLSSVTEWTVATHEPLETLLARMVAVEAHLTLGQLECGRRTLLTVLDWWEAHGRTPLVALVMGGLPRTVAYARVSGDPKLAFLHAQYVSRYGPPLETIRLVTLTAQPELRFGDQTVPLSNRHVIPLLVYLHARGTRGATVAEVGRDLFPELRGERLRNRVKNARVELRAAIEAACQTNPYCFGNLTNLRVTSEGNTRSMMLRLESGNHAVLWDLEELERALTSGTGDWVWLLSSYHGEFFEGYEVDGDEHWIQRLRDRLQSKLLERAAALVSAWFSQGQLDALRSLVSRLLELGIFDPASPLTDLMAAYEVRAVGTLSGKAAALAIWMAHHTRFQAAFVDAPELEAVHPTRTTN